MPYCFTVRLCIIFANYLVFLYDLEEKQYTLNNHDYYILILKFISFYFSHASFAVTVMKILGDTESDLSPDWPGAMCLYIPAYLEYQDRSQATVSGFPRSCCITFLKANHKIFFNNILIRD